MRTWMLAALENAGYTDTNEGLISRVAWYLAKSPNDVIEAEEFRSACIACGVDPDSFTPDDLDRLQQKLERL